MRASGVPPRDFLKSAMLDKLRAIDKTAVNKLAKVKQEQHLLKAYLKKAEELKDQVKPAVYEAVQQDYEARHAALERQAEPLRGEARKDYQKVRSLCEQIEAALAQATLDKETLEFRCAVGELGKDQLAGRLGDVERVLSERRAELEEANELRKHFIEAFRSEDELEGEPPPPPTPFSDKTVIVSDFLARTGPVARPVTPDRDLAESPSSSPSLKTLVLPDAKFIKEEESGSEIEYRLGVLTYIGRTEDNHISIAAPGVSRRHAQVTAGPQGFTLKDLESQNGTFVNDRRVAECLLANGDRVRIGFVQLLFRSSSL